MFQLTAFWGTENGCDLRAGGAGWCHPLTGDEEGLTLGDSLIPDPGDTEYLSWLEKLDLADGGEKLTGIGAKGECECAAGSGANSELWAHNPAS